MGHNEFSGYYKHPIPKRREILAATGMLEQKELDALFAQAGLPLETADRMIENVIGAFPLPLGIATNFIINGKEAIVPMVLEEPSVVAAASNAAKMAQECGGFRATSTESIMIGEIALARLPDFDKALETLNSKKKKIMEIASPYAAGIAKYGGGIRSLEISPLETPAGKMILLKFYVDVKDAMGANTINTIVELSAPEIEKIAGGEARLRIISNLAPKRIARASATWKAKTLGAGIADKIIEGWAIAAADPYRCATHNKGIMNGIDAVAIATGQDFRAIEAGCHAYAALGGAYKPLTRYYKDANGDLVGEIEIPVPVGIVGGAVRTHPMAGACLKLLNVKTARELGEAIACVGLAQNFAALRAITTEGIQKGHMKLHAKNIAVNAGAAGEEIEKVSELMISQNKIGVENATAILKEIRKGTAKKK
ncbi:MAG: hydroxymethylglutaryl-CoA reductase, degradative [Candidatus Micrarchaeia archaeon]